MPSPTPINKPRQVELEEPLPQNIEAERYVLGAILIAEGIPNPALKIAAEKLHSSDFFSPAHSSGPHERIFRAMLKLDEAQKPIDHGLLNEQLRNDGELESAGGAAYILSLGDGMPRINNLEHYAGIVREKSLLRALIHKIYAIQQRAFEGEKHEELLADVGEYVKYSRGDNRSRLVAVDVRDFLLMNLEPLDWAIDPLLTIKGRGMIFAERGAGKTYITMQIAHSVATGQPECFVWRIPQRRRVVYVDGEMHSSMLQDRQVTIVRANGGEPPEKGQLVLITRDLQKDVRPKINTKVGRDQIEAHLEPGTLLILDNLSSLSPSAQDRETDDWIIIEDWFSDLCWHGVTVLFDHHAGKSGEQRGTSMREDLLDFVLRLRVPSDKTPDEPLRAEVQVTKLRGKVSNPRQGQPFEVRLGTGEHGDPEWFIRPLRDLLKERAKQMLAMGMPPRDVKEETGLSRDTIYRIKRELATPGAKDSVN